MMGFFSFLFPWGLILQAIALVHFIRRRPDGIWIYIIVFLGGLGALVYIAMEVLPDLGLLRQSFDSYGRRKRIKQLEAVVLENPAAGNYEELMAAGGAYRGMVLRQMESAESNGAGVLP